jgi:hypothetical protein
MSESFNVQTVTIAFGPVVGAQDVPLFRVPTVGGGITVVDGLLTINNTGGTTAAALFGTAVAARVVTHGTLAGVANGTAGSAVPAVDGTVGYFGALGSINLGAGTVHTLLAGTPYIGPGKFVNYAHTAGTLLGGFTVQISYVMGK